MEINKQPIEKLRPYDGRIEVHSQWITIQGEGPFAGTPAIFLRLAGCDLQCPLCDTLYADRREAQKVEDIVTFCKRELPRLVVITGGEPFRQKIGELCSLLVHSGKKVQIETNGTLYSDVSSLVTVVCSPKTSKIHPAMAECVDAWKYVLRHDAVSPLDGLPTSALGMKQPPARPTNHFEIYVQPCDDQDEEINRLNVEAAVDSCLRFGYRLCLQTHKIVGLP